MYQYEGEDVFVIDGHIHYWDATEENIIHEGGEQFIQCVYDFHVSYTPDDQVWPMNEFRRYSMEKAVEDLFRNGYVDVGIFQPVYLRAFYDRGWNPVGRSAELAERYPERFVLNGNFDARDGEEGLRDLERQKDRYGITGAKVYTASWRDDSKGWRLDSPEAFEYLERCRELGITNIHAHKGPTIRPLNHDAFKVDDIDDAATSFPELNFVVEHVGLPRLDDFCWIASQETNVYGGLASVTPFARVRPKAFREMMGELLFYLGPEKLLFSSDYAIWEPGWIVEAVMETEFSQEERAEYGVEFDLDTKKKIMGENAARLYDIDVEERRRTLRNDSIGEALERSVDAGEADAD